MNSKNLKHLLDIILILDRPNKYWNHKSPHNPLQPISFPMHSDLKAGNILISKDEAGIVDFEYLDFIKLFPFSFSKQNKNWGIIVNHSDIRGIPSNLRNFEYRTLLPYLEQCDNPKALILPIIIDVIFIKLKFSYVFFNELIFGLGLLPSYVYIYLKLKNKKPPQPTPQF